MIDFLSCRDYGFFCDDVELRMRAKEPFDDAVFAGMEADDRESAGGREGINRRSQRFFELAILVIDGDAERLEDIGGRMASANPRNLFVGMELPPVDVEDDTGKIKGPEKRFGASLRNNCVCNRPGVPIFAVRRENRVELLRRRCGDELRCRMPCSRIKPHVERSVDLEGKPARGIGDVMPGDPEIEDNGLNGEPRVDAGQCFLHSRGGKFCKDGPVSKRRQSVFCPCKRTGVAIEREETARWTACLKNRPCVTAVPCRAVYRVSTASNL